MGLSFKLKWDDKAAREVPRRAAKRALLLAAEHVLGEANKDVPHDTGILQASGQTHVAGSAEPSTPILKGTSPRTKEKKTLKQPPLETVKAEDGLVAAVFYNTPYAVRLHEHEEYNFQEGRRGKWLENALFREASTVKRIIADSLRGAL